MNNTILVEVSTLIARYPKIREMDLNPVFVPSSGSIVADARVIIGE